MKRVIEDIFEEYRRGNFFDQDNETILIKRIEELESALKKKDKIIRRLTKKRSQYVEEHKETTYICRMCGATVRESKSTP